MFYNADAPHGLAFNPFKAIVGPRPIGWISTLAKNGAPNLAPYSFFMAVADQPPVLMFSSSGIKDSARNAIDTKEFTFNYVSRSAQHDMNTTSGGYPPEEDEFKTAGLEMAEGVTVKCPRVKNVPAAMECKVIEIFTPTLLDGSSAHNHVIFGQVTGIYIDDEMITDGRFNVEKADPVMRCGYRDYTGIDGLFELIRPEGGGGM